MTHYNSVKNIQISHSQLNKSKSAIKNETEVTIRLLSNMIGMTNETRFQHNFLFAYRHIASFCKAFANHSSVNIKLTKTQNHSARWISW